MSKRDISWFMAIIMSVVLSLVGSLNGQAFAASQDIPVSADSDDAEEATIELDENTLKPVADGNPGGEVDLGSSDLELTLDGSFQVIGLRFNEVGIPPGAEVTNAYTQFMVDEAHDVPDPSFVIRGEASDNAATFEEKDHNISSRKTTEASVKWSPPLWENVGKAGPNQRTPDLSAIIQEIVNRPGWAKGNSLALTISGEGYHVATAHDAGKPSTLHLEWSVYEYSVGLAQKEVTGPENNKQTSLEVKLSKKADKAISVDYEVTDISTDGNDYSPHGAKGTLTFKPGMTSQSIDVTINDDRKPEETEQFKIALTGINGAGLDAGIDDYVELIYTIKDSSPRVSFVEENSMSEESVGTVAVAVDLSNPWDKNVTVNYAVKPEGTGAKSDDFDLLGTGTLTFKPGVTSQRIRIAVVDDETEERTEKITLALSSPREALLGNVVEHVYRIKTNDVGPDWPMWRHNAGRTAATPVALPDELELQWVLELPKLEPAWPRGDGAVTGFEDLDVEDGQGRRLTFDIAYAPIIVGKTMYIGSSHDDSIRAYDTETGAEKWHFYADAPVRFAPAVWNGKLYFSSDDGHLYCINADDGALQWKFRGGPSNRKVIGNKRLGSTWPARGAPTVLDGIVYFGAGIWPFEGSFIYALDAATGDIVWVNDGSGQLFMRSPHSGAWSFNAVAPQGYFVANENKLIVPNGRAVAAGFNRGTGEYLYFHFGENNRNGTAYVAAIGPYFQNSYRLFNISDGSDAANMHDGAVLTDTAIYATVRNETGDPAFSEIQALNVEDLSEKWEYSVRVDSEVFCMAGDRLYLGSEGHIGALDDHGDSAELAWEEVIVGTPREMLAGDGKLIVVTEEGYIYCFGEDGDAEFLPSGLERIIAWQAPDEWTTKARAIIDATGQTEGHCLVLGVGTGRLMEELARLNPAMHVIGLDPDPDKVEALRVRWDERNIPRERLSALVGDIVSAGLPPYLANLIASEDTSSAGTVYGDAFVKKAFFSLRPYGGQICLAGNLKKLFNSGVKAANLAKADVKRSGGYTILAREGALPGSADWSHQYADAANTVMSKDKLVKTPMGLLWYGGSSNKQILPRHRHGPTEQVVGGRLFIEGPDLMRAIDVYTGRVMWEAKLPGLARAFAKFPIFRENEGHEPGANHMGSNYATVSDGMYVANGAEIYRLDPATGERLATFAMPDKSEFGQVKIWKDLVIAAVDPLVFDDRSAGEDNWNKTGSKWLVALDRYSGKIRWEQTADNAFHHNTIIIGNDMVFCIDRLPPGQEANLSRRGMTPAGAQYKVLAFNVSNGKPIWSTSENVFGTWLSYSGEHDVLLQSGRKSPDMVSGEVTGRIISYHGKNGQVRWDKSEGIDDGPYLLLHETIYMQNSQYKPSYALNLLTGEVAMRTDPLTGQSVPWHFMRNKGCNSIVGCENLLTFRSGAAAFYDLANNGGIGHFGGFKSGCSTNLVPANGVLNAPDYTRSCNCSYQNQTSLAMVYMPGVDIWTHGSVETPEAPIVRAGINLGAPGDRLADSGTLWMEYPVPQYGDSAGSGHTYPNLDVRTVPEEIEVFRHHTTRFEGDGLEWVASSGALGMTEISIDLDNSEQQLYDIRLVFAEPKDIDPKQRMFSVELQGDEVLPDFDVVQAAGGPRRTIVKEFRNVKVKDGLTVRLIPADNSPIKETLLCGIEAIAGSGTVSIAAAR